MKNLQHILEDCLKRLSDGTATLDECLGLYSEHAEQLEPLLKVAFLLNGKRNLMLSPTFNAFGRYAIIRFAQSHPRQPRGGIALSWRTVMASMALVLALLFTGTAHAQSAMPGDLYYDWKRTSELAWRALTTDPVAVDVILAERRLTEWIAVADDPKLSVSARNNYQEALFRLESGNNEKSRELIVSKLQSQKQLLNNAGLSNSELDGYLDEVLLPAIVPVTGIEPVATKVPAITTEVPSTTTDILVTEVPVESGSKDCVPNCGNNQSNTSKNGEKEKNDQKGNEGGNDRGNNGNKGNQDNNGKGPK